MNQSEALAIVMGLIGAIGCMYWTFASTSFTEYLIPTLSGGFVAITVTFFFIKQKFTLIRKK